MLYAPTWEGWSNDLALSSVPRTGLTVVKTLLARRGAVVYFLLRPESEDKVAALHEYWGVDPQRAVPVFGDLTAKKLGVAADQVKKLKGQIDQQQQGLTAGGATPGG